MKKTIFLHYIALHIACIMRLLGRLMEYGISFRVLLNEYLKEILFSDVQAALK